MLMVNYNVVCVLKVLTELLLMTYIGIHYHTTFTMIWNLDFNFLRSDILVMLAFAFSILMLVFILKKLKWYKDLLYLRLGFIASLFCYMFLNSFCLTCTKYHLIVISFTMLILYLEGKYEKRI